MYLTNENRKIVKDYLHETLKKKCPHDESYELANTIAEFINSDYRMYDIKLYNLKEKLWTNEVNHIQDIFSNTSEKAYKSLVLLLGKSSAETFIQVWNRCVLYPYGSGYDKGTFRSNRSSHIYFKKNIGKLNEWVYLTARSFSLLKYLEGSMEGFEYLSIISDTIALEVDKNNQEVISRIKNLIYNNQNSVMLNREIIKGMLMSKNEEIHKMIGELLLAAKLQEGLRQAIVENMNEASKEGFFYILKLIIDHKLTRFSSIVRGFTTWTGLSLDVQNPQIVDKTFKSVHDCLFNPKIIMDYVQDEDELLIYIGLWATAFNEIDDIVPLVSNLLEKEEKIKNLGALYFLYQTQFNVLKHEMACKVLGKNDYEILVWAIKNLYPSNDYYNIYYYFDKKLAIDSLKLYCNLDNQFQERELFEQLKKILEKMPKKEMSFKAGILPEIKVKLKSSEILDKMMLAIISEYDKEQVDYLIGQRKKMSPEGRLFLIENFLLNLKDSFHKKALLEACGDRSEFVRNKAFELVNHFILEAEDYQIIEDFLRLKSGHLRKKAIHLLLKQDNQSLVLCMKRLFQSKDENKRLAAMDMLLVLEKDENRQDIYKECLQWVDNTNKATPKENILLRKINREKDDNQSFEKGFGLYNPLKEIELPSISVDKLYNHRVLFSIDVKKIIGILQSFSQLIHNHRTYEYEGFGIDGVRRRVILGESQYLLPFHAQNQNLDGYPLGEEVRNLKEKFELSSSQVIVLAFYSHIVLVSRFEEYTSWYLDLLDSFFQIKTLKTSIAEIKRIPYLFFIDIYFHLLLKEIPREEAFKIIKDVASFLLKNIPLKQHQLNYANNKNNNFFISDFCFQSNRFLASSYEISYWINSLKNFIYDDKSFESYFWIVYTFYKSGNYTDHITLDLDTFAKALEKGIIDENEVYEEFMARTLSPNNISNFTCPIGANHRPFMKLRAFMNIGNKAIETIANIEAKRGELNTQVTHLAAKIQRCYGLEILVSILFNLENDTFVRGYNFILGDCTKRQILSKLLKCCYPSKEDTKDKLKNLLKGKKIKDKQLIEIAMYAPQWLDIISHYLDYPGLKSACWYFHAHVNDFFSEEKTVMVARYSPISIENLKDGAFDYEWFKEAYTTLGEKRFKLVYNSAKYIARGGLHRRSQLFADAYLGKLDFEEVKKRVTDKRNKDYLLCFGLIPLKSKKDLLSRYEFINQYKKEAKQFGVQRQASETRCADIALFNLARNAGFSEVNRLIWNMETEKKASIMPYLNPYQIEDIELRLEIDEYGQSEIICTKEGKKLKNIPAKLIKHEYVKEIKVVHNSLKNQLIRVRQSFEEAMIKEEYFEVEELNILSKNPVISPIIRHLVFLHDDYLGYFVDGNLVNYKGEMHFLQPKNQVKIAHPVHLNAYHQWAYYQKDLFKKKIKQPFRQVFRELYSPNEDEINEKIISRRYAGHPIQPKKTLALLKSRGWIVSYEQGLQKIFYNENIVATIYALVDWFLPADIEAATIEAIQFEDRKSYQSISINQVPPVIFSETMRDLDLVVSVAHLAEVDPEASLSTVQIRAIIIEEMIKLLKLKNIKIKKNHAFIEGNYGEYTVHLGSGVVHKMATGAIFILPVHSEHRGRIFLPFMDEDPKTAEIISKIILLSEDTKIKDPSILRQINS